MDGSRCGTLWINRHSADGVLLGRFYVTFSVVGHVVN